jgi:hypothetical protein
MRLSDFLIFALCIGFFILALYETYTLGFRQSYWLFMMSVGLLFLYQLRKLKMPKESAEPPSRKGRQSKGRTK